MISDRFVRIMKLSKLESHLKTLSEAGGCLAAIGTALVAMASSIWMFRLLEYVVIHQVYGDAAWLEGLRIVDKHGNLSNGDFLPAWAHITVSLGTFVLMIPFFFGSAALFGYVGLRLQGRRLNDPKPKPPRMTTSRGLSRRSRDLGIERWPVRPRLNGQIVASSVNVITEEGAPLGILPTAEALKLVASRREDLVEIGPDWKPPLCQAIDYAKYRDRFRQVARVP